ncbi:hypothetical protein, partial [Streptomyces sp. SID5785]|uniref:hypothetical protein n=1 Tax=Streptomyces sp. SID5785 TaxID=2690309 RepID=UPI001F30FC61
MISVVIFSAHSAVRRARRTWPAVAVRVLAVLATAWLCGAPSGAAALARTGDCAYASVDGGAAGGGAVVVSGDG